MSQLEEKICILSYGNVHMRMRFFLSFVKKVNRDVYRTNPPKHFSHLQQCELEIFL